jgi:hypothetical protein
LKRIKRLALVAGVIARVTRKRVLYRGMELTGIRQAANLIAGKIEISADALRISFIGSVSFLS